MGPAALASSLGALATLALGLFGLLHPDGAARLVGLAPEGRLGRSELRATYGGLFLGLGLACLLLQAPAAFAAAGCAWLATGLARVLSLVLDASRSGKNLTAVGVELVVAALLLAGPLAGA